MTDYFKLVDDYFEGQLSKEDSLGFEKELLTNENLKKAYAEYQESKKMSEALLQMDIFDSIEKAKKSGPPKNSTTHAYWISGFMLLALVLAAIYWFVTQGSTTDQKGLTQVQFAELYKEPIWPIVRSSEDTLMQQAMFLFQQKNDLEGAKEIILKDEFLTPQIRKYWISEMYLKNQAWDSVAFYLPSFELNSTKYDRVKYIESILSQVNKQ